MKKKITKLKISLWVTYGDPPPKKTKLHSFFLKLILGKMEVASLHKYRKKKKKKLRQKKEKKF